MTNKQRLFIEAYLTYWNATKAAIEAGYSPDTAYSIGSENLKKPEIAAAIQQAIDERAMSANEVLLRLASHARGTMEDFIDPDSLTLDLRKAAESGQLHLIKKFKVTTITKDDAQTDVTEFELYDSQAALVHLGRHHKLFTDKMSLDGELTVNTPTIYLPAIKDDE